MFLKRGVVISWQLKTTLPHPSAWKPKQVFYTKPRCFPLAVCLNLSRGQAQCWTKRRNRKFNFNKLRVATWRNIQVHLHCGFAEMYVANIHSGDYAQNGYDYIITLSDAQTRNVELYLAEVSRKCHRKRTVCPSGLTSWNSTDRFSFV